MRLSDNRHCYSFFDICNMLFMIFFLFIMIYPFYYLLILSLNEGMDAVRGGIYFWPRVFSLDNYIVILTDDSLVSCIIMSILRVLVGTITQLFATGLLSYIIIIRWFSGRRFIRVLFLITMYIGGGLIPYYLLLLKLGLTNTFQVYWIPSLFNAYYMLLISSYMQNIPESLFESARIDGASEFLIYICLAIPTCIPVLAAVAVYIAIGHWNSWFDVTIYNPNGKFDTLQVFLRRLILEAEAYQKMQESEIAVQKVRAANLRPKTIKAATTMVATIPIILVYPFFQRYFVRGITLGSVKE